MAAQVSYWWKVEDDSETFDAWCRRNGVEVHRAYHETDIAIGLLKMCPFFAHEDYRAEARYDILVMLNEGSEEDYLNFFVMNQG